MIERAKTRQAEQGLTNLSWQVGDVYSLTVRRNGQEITVKSTVAEKEVVRKYVFQVDPQATPAQVQLREVWQRYGPQATTGVSYLEEVPAPQATGAGR